MILIPPPAYCVTEFHIFICRLGKGCTHVAALFFSLDKDELDENEDEPCTSKPCTWNKPSKRIRTNDPIDQINFKKVRYGKVHVDEPVVVTKQTPVIDKNKFFRTLCCKVSNQNSVLLHMIDSNNFPEPVVPVECDLNVANVEEVVTSEHILDPSDEYIHLSTSVGSSANESEFCDFVKNVPSEVIETVEHKTRGQAENPTWIESRKGRITASLFHDVASRRDSTSPKNLVQNILGKTNDISTAAMSWGRKYEPIAKKKYIAVNRLKFKKTVKVSDCGLFLCHGHGFIGASPDGVAVSKSEKWLIEIKCPFKWRKKQHHRCL